MQVGAWHQERVVGDGMVAVSALAKRISAEMTKLLPVAGSVMDLNEAFPRRLVFQYPRRHVSGCVLPERLGSYHSSCEIGPLPVPQRGLRFNNGDHIAMERHGVSQVGIGVFRTKERAMTSSGNSSTDISPRPEKSGGRTPPKPATPSPAPEKISGAGPAVAEHSKDAKAPRGGRQPGAYVKD